VRYRGPPEGPPHFWFPAAIAAITPAPLSPRTPTPLPKRIRSDVGPVPHRRGPPKKLHLGLPFAGGRLNPDTATLPPPLPCNESANRWPCFSEGLGPFFSTPNPGRKRGAVGFPPPPNSHSLRHGPPWTLRLGGLGGGKTPFRLFWKAMVAPPPPLRNPRRVARPRPPKTAGVGPTPPAERPPHKIESTLPPCRPAIASSEHRPSGVEPPLRPTKVQALTIHARPAGPKKGPPKFPKLGGTTRRPSAKLFSPIPPLAVSDAAFPFLFSLRPLRAW